jgi:hypothetical protein
MNYKAEETDLLITTIHRANGYDGFDGRLYRIRVTRLLVGSSPDFEIYYSQWGHNPKTPRIDLMPTVDL